MSSCLPPALLLLSWAQTLSCEAPAGLGSITAHQAGARGCAHGAIRLGVGSFPARLGCGQPPCSPCLGVTAPCAGFVQH